MSNGIMNPMAWLWHELEPLLTFEEYEALRMRFEVHNRAYNRLSLLKTARRELAFYEQVVTTYGPDSPRYLAYQRKITNRKARIAQLETEIDNADMPS